MNRHHSNGPARSRRPVLLTLLGIVVVLGSFALWQARPLYRWGQKQRALLLVNEIDRHLRNEEFALAFSRVSKAYRLAPDEPRILRAGARATMSAGGGEALFFLQRLHDTGAATFEDRVDLAKAYLMTGDLERAGSHGDRLLVESPDNPDVLLPAFEIQLASGNFAKAKLLGERMLLINPEDTVHRLRLSYLCFLHGNEEDQEIAVRYLRVVAREATPEGRKAIRLLLHRENLDADLQRELIGLVQNHPLSDEPLSLQALSLSINLSPIERREIVLQAMEERRDWTPAELTPFVLWLVAHDEREFLVENISPETAVRNASILLNYIDALSNLARWDELAELLERPNLPVSESLLHAIQAFYAQRGQREDSEVGRESLVEAVTSLKRLGAYHEALIVARFAEKLGHLDLAEAAYEFAAASKAERTAGHAFENLMRLANKDDDIRKLRSVAGRYHHRFPYRKELEEHALYLNTLLGIEIEKTLHEALASVARDPTHLSSRITAALASFRMGDLDTAARLCRECKPADLSPGQKAVWGAVTSATGCPEAAQAVIREIPRHQLLEEERRLLDSIPGSPFEPVALF